ncbi:DHA2 family efflux MFS transporter permease subunit, partial [Paenibacillus sepulcri]|nr:DHA2 family efflux MFS transporter permease subunit [Paenibacillus sepulcri]
MNSSGLESKPASVDLSGIRRGPIITALIIGAFVAILNETLLSNALPDLMREFGIELSTIQWLSTAYMLVIGVLVPVTALLQQWFTTRQMFLSAMILFLVGTLVCSISSTFGVLLVGRVIQAMGTGLLLPIMMNTILAIYPPDKRGGAMGLMGLVIMSAPAIGPTLSGLIIDSLDWRWLFYLVLPLTAFSIVFAAVYLKNVSDITKPKVDILSIIISTIGFGGLVYGFSKAGGGSWSDPEVYWTIIIGCVALALFVWRQLTMKEPLLDLRAFKFPMFSLVVVLLLVLMMTMFSTLTLLPQFLQSVLLMSALTSGLVMMPGSILNGIMAPVSGVLFDKYGPRLLVVPGLVLVVASLALFMGIHMGTSTGYIILSHIIMLVGISLVMMPAQTTGLNQLPRHLYPHGTAILNTLQQVAGAVGTALFISILASGTKKYLSSHDATAPDAAALGLVAGLQNAFLIGLIVA